MTDAHRFPAYDHVFRNAVLYDGSGGAPVAGELAVSGERIALVGGPGAVPRGSGRTEHDLRGRALAPGFIDAHTHDDRIRHQPGIMAKQPEAAAEMVRADAGLHADQAGRHIGEARFTCPRDHFCRSATAPRPSRPTT